MQTPAQLKRLKLLRLLWGVLLAVWSSVGAFAVLLFMAAWLANPPGDVDRTSSRNQFLLVLAAWVTVETTLVFRLRARSRQIAHHSAMLPRCEIEPDSTQQPDGMAT